MPERHDFRAAKRQTTIVFFAIAAILIALYVIFGLR